MKTLTKIFDTAMKTVVRGTQIVMAAATIYGAGKIIESALTEQEDSLRVGVYFFLSGGFGSVGTSYVRHRIEGVI